MPWPMIWTDDDDTKLRGYRSEGMSYGRMEELRLFPGKTRNAIIGRAARIGLSGTRGVGSAHSLVPKETCTRKPRSPQAPRPKQIIQRSLFDELAVLPVMDLPPESSEFAISFFEANLNDGKCRYPIGDTHNLHEFKFCGGQVFEDRPYCVHHCRLCYRKPEKPPTRGGERERPNTGGTGSIAPERAA